jgi:hypothetical protein
MTAARGISKRLKLPTHHNKLQRLNLAQVKAKVSTTKNSTEQGINL